MNGGGQMEPGCPCFGKRMRLRKLAWLLLPLSLLLALVLAQAPRSSAQAIERLDSTPKIDRWVLNHTAANQEAEFLVVLAERADLSQANRLVTRAAKGRYVYETLFAHAQRTQRPVIAWLEQRGIEYRSFYIVNAIWVKADRETALALAARLDVARLDVDLRCRRVRHDRRRVVHFNITEFPSATWTAQQIIEAFPEDTAPKYMIHDRDGIYGDDFRHRVANMGIEEVLTAPRSPWRPPSPAASPPAAAAARAAP